MDTKYIMVVSILLMNDSVLYFVTYFTTSLWKTTQQKSSASRYHVIVPLHFIPSGLYWVTQWNGSLKNIHIYHALQRSISTLRQNDLKSTVNKMLNWNAVTTANSTAWEFHSQKPMPDGPINN